MRFVSFLAVTVCLVSVPAAAQSASVRRAPAKKAHVGAVVFGIVENQSMTATQSFDAVLDTSSVTLVGAGGDIVNLWKTAFARVAVTHVQQTGTRVAVNGTTTVPLNIPLTLSMTPIELGGGWRFGGLDAKSHVVPYVGAAALFLQYRETSEFADADENTSSTFTGGSFFGGVDIAIKVVHVGVEGILRTVPNAIGAAGASQAFNETNLGGGVVRFFFGVGF